LRTDRDDGDDNGDIQGRRLNRLEQLLTSIGACVTS